MLSSMNGNYEDNIFSNLRALPCSNDGEVSFFFSFSKESTNLNFISMFG